MVLLETGEDREISQKYALLPPEADFYQILSDAEINIKDLGNDFYEPNLGITFGDVITFIFFGASLVLVYIMLKNMQGSGGKILDFGQSKARLLMGKKTGILLKM
jgi:ATP-dependent Zn protease